MAKLFCLMGIPGAGKSTVLYGLHKENSNDLIIVPRITDRGIREDELPTEINPEYSFESRTWFKVLERNNAFASVENLGNYNYAVRQDDLLKIFNDGCPGLIMSGYCGLDIQKQYPDKVRSIFLAVPGINFQECFIMPQAIKDLTQRLRQRGDSQDKIQQRLELAKKIIQIDKVHLKSDCILINKYSQLEETIKDLKEIILSD